MKGTQVAWLLSLCVRASDGHAVARKIGTVNVVVIIMQSTRERAEHHSEGLAEVRHCQRLGFADSVLAELYGAQAHRRLQSLPLSNHRHLEGLPAG